jgi:hypothetical protein
MASPAQELTLDRRLLEPLKFSGITPENLADLVSIIVSFKNKYGILPFATAAEGQPVPDKRTACYVLESITLNKVRNVLLDTPRLSKVTLCRAEFPSPRNSRSTSPSAVDPPHSSCPANGLDTHLFPGHGPAVWAC